LDGSEHFLFAEKVEGPIMSRASGFISPDELRLSFPATVSTDEQRVLYALWRERVQAIDRLCLHTGLPPLRVMKAVRELSRAGRLRVNAEVADWLEQPESERPSANADLSDRLAEERVSLA
jgi:hypothetical protein